ncbi:MAG: hypothetical protein R3F07_04720 [Opitutaceae bacterium]
MIRVDRIELFRKQLRTRMPFRYGIATMVDVPHVFLRLHLETPSGRSLGISADHLPPKWFTKDPERDPLEEIDEMLEVLRHAIGLAAGRKAASPFAFWMELYREQAAWAPTRGIPPLLAHFGVTLVERALVDAWCRGQGIPFPRAVRENRLGIELGRIHNPLTERSPGEFLPDHPPETVHARHTVGLSDPLRESDIPDGERLSDGLPQSLEASIRAYGLTHFKIKVQGDPDRDIPRLREIARILDRSASPDYRASLDGNESFRTGASFAGFWTDLRKDPALGGLLSRMLFIEQPLHRAIALEEPIREAARPDGTPCPIIIDESDAALDSLPKALELGYAGTSHKNCKGVFKGIANRCLIRFHVLQGRTNLMMSGEDLSNIGPVALLQDLAVQATLGIDSIERNGHHYFAGLAAFPDTLQADMIRHHGDLYRREPGQPARLALSAGRVHTRSVLNAPFGCAFRPDLESFAEPI